MTRSVGLLWYLLVFCGPSAAGEEGGHRRACWAMYFWSAWAWYFGGRSVTLMATSYTSAAASGISTYRHDMGGEVRPNSASGLGVLNFSGDWITHP